LGTSPSPFGEGNVTRSRVRARRPAPRSRGRLRALGIRGPGPVFPAGYAWRIRSASSLSTSMTQLIPEIAAASRVRAQRSSRAM